MKKIKDWMNTPFTWGGYLKACGICWIIGNVISLVWLVATGWIDLTDIFVKKEKKPEE